MLKRFFGSFLASCSTNATVSTVENSIDEDSQLSEYLRYYAQLSEPGYAVLVTGEWGCGKTYQVKRIIPESERYYVSLYGLTSSEQIHDAVLAACLPHIKLDGTFNILGDVGKSMGDKYALAGLAGGLWKTYLRQKLSNQRIIIFDDLERSSLWNSDKETLLGAINHYVEEKRFRVVAICYDGRISEYLKEVKEKTFGHTIHVQAQVEDAMSSFINDLCEAESTFVASKRHIVSEIWGQSGQMSLRILKHVISDIGRLYKTLAPKHLENNSAVEQIVRFFVALNIEVRAGRVNRQSLTKRMISYVGATVLRDREPTREETIIQEMAERYPTAEITSEILSDEILQATLIDGRYDQRKIVAWLDQSPLFITPSDAPPWQVVIQLDSLDESTLWCGINRMERQFESREIYFVGEFMHIAALRLLFCEQGVYPRSLDEETKLCISCVDDLFAMGKLQATSPHYGYSSEHDLESYGGYGYWKTKATLPHFNQIASHIMMASHKAFEAQYPTKVEEILHLLQEDTLSLVGEISDTNSGHNPWSFIPILGQIPPQGFITAWLSGSRSGWRRVSRALENRYRHGRLTQYLSLEVAWLIELEKEFDCRIRNSDALSAFRLKRLKPDQVFSLAKQAGEQNKQS